MRTQERYGAEILSRLAGKDLVGIEVGVARGWLSAVLLSDPRVSHLDMVDNWERAERQPESYRATGDPHASLGVRTQESVMAQAEEETRFAGERRTILRMDSILAAEETPDGFADFVFIDADHSYQGITDDIRSWAGKVKEGGLLCGHDYDRPEPGYDGVKRAVDDAARENGWSVELGDEYTWFVRMR